MYSSSLPHSGSPYATAAVAAVSLPIEADENEALEDSLNRYYRQHPNRSTHLKVVRRILTRRKSRNQLLVSALFILGMLVAPFGSVSGISSNTTVAANAATIASVPANIASPSDSSQGDSVSPNKLGSPTKPNVPLGGVEPGELLGGYNPSVMWHCASCGTPVNTGTGNFWHTFTDLSIPSRGVGLTFQRTYNSLNSGYCGPLGCGWSFNWNMYATRGLYTWVINQENGSFVHFDTGPYYHDPRVLADWNGQIFSRKHAHDNYYFVNYSDPNWGIYGIWKLDHIIARNGLTTTLGYEPVPGHSDWAPRIHSVTDPESRSLTFYYDDSTRPTLITRITDPASRAMAFGYDAASNMTVFTDVNGLATHFTYDANHHMLTMQDPNGGQVTNTYDANGRVLTQSDPMSRTMQFSYSAPQAPLTTTITDTLGIVTQHVYLDSYRLSRVIRNANAPVQQQQVWQYGYNDPYDGIAITSVTDPNNNTWTYTWGHDYDYYNTYNNGDLLTATDPLSRTTQFGYNASNDLTVVTNTLGVTTTFSYDSHGNLVTITRPLTQTGQLITTTFGYDSSPAHVGDVLTATNPLGKSWHYTYDQYGYLASATDPLANTKSFSHNNLAWLLSVTDPMSHTTSFSYSPYGDPLIITDTRSYASTYTYDNDRNLLTASDANHHAITNTFDLDNELTRSTQPDGSQLAWGYDSYGRVLTQTNGLGQNTLYSYDDINRVVSVVDPLGRKASYSYDLAGNTTVITDAAGLTTTLGYDSAYQLRSITYHDGSTPNVSFDYNALGMRTVMTDGIGTWLYSYDSLNRLTSSRDGYQNTVQYGYDVGSRLTSLVYPGTSHTVSRGYDDDNRLVSVTDWLSNTTRFGYNPDSALTSITYPNNVVSSIGYDAANEVISTTHTYTPTANTFLSFTYAHDPVGVISNTVDSPTGTHNYSYDPLYRLTGDQITGPFGSNSTWSYDAAAEITSTTYTGGNIINTARAYDAADELTTFSQTTNGTQTQKITLGYNKNGDRTSLSDSISGSKNSYSYDQADRLTKYTSGSTLAYAYDYNGDGLRMSKTNLISGPPPPFTPGKSPELAVPIHYTWDIAEGLPLLLQENAASYLYGPGGQLIEQIDSSGNAYYYHADQLGSVRALTNSAGSVVNTYSYDVYGNVTASTGTVYNPFKFAASYTDGESNLLYLRSRYYDPANQQFLTRDPLVELTQQPYAYAGGSPLNSVDPSGRCGPLCFIGVGAAIGAVVGGVSYALTCGNNCNVGDAALAIGGGAIGGAFAGAEVGVAVLAAAEGAIVGGETGVAAAVKSNAVAETVQEATENGGGASVAAYIGPPSPPGISVSISSSAPRADFEVTPNGVAIPTSRACLEKGFQDAGFQSYPNARTAEPGTNYVDPNTGNIIRVMNGSPQNGPRMVTHAPSGNPLMPDGSNIPGNVIGKAVRKLTHFPLEP